MWVYPSKNPLEGCLVFASQRAQHVTYVSGSSTHVCAPLHTCVWLAESLGRTKCLLTNVKVKIQGQPPLKSKLRASLHSSDECTAGASSDASAALRVPVRVSFREAGRRSQPPRFSCDQAGRWGQGLIPTWCFSDTESNSTRDHSAIS